MARACNGTCSVNRRRWPARSPNSDCSGAKGQVAPRPLCYASCPLLFLLGRW
jgi:hypothetical protein